MDIKGSWQDAVLRNDEEAEMKNKVHISSIKIADHLSEKWLDFFTMLLLLGVSPFLMFPLEVGSVSIQSLFFFYVILVALFVHLIWRDKLGWKFPNMREPMGWMVILTWAGIIISMIRKMASNLAYISFDGEVFLFAITGAFILFGSKKNFQIYYFDFIVYSGLIVSGMLLYHFICVSDLDMATCLLIENEDALVSYMVLLGTTNVLQYCRCRNKRQSFFYAVCAVLSFFILFISQNTVGIGMMVFVFIVIPLLFRPTMELVKKDLQMFFLYLFLLSNMSLIARYTDFIRIELSYDLLSGLYLGLIIAVGGVGSFHFWEKIPTGADAERLVPRSMRKGYQLFCIAVLIMALIAVLGNVGDGFTEGKNGFQFVYEQTDVWGVLLLAVVLALSIEGFHRNYNPNKPTTTQLIILAGVFILQLFFWKPMIQTLPIYTILFLSALYLREESDSNQYKD